jgi:hypothetical protein
LSLRHRDPYSNVNAPPALTPENTRKAARIRSTSIVDVDRAVARRLLILQEATHEPTFVSDRPLVGLSTS